MMRAIKLAVACVAVVVATAGQVQAGIIFDSTLYTFLDVSGPGSGQASINNLGEIVYKSIDVSGNHQIISTTRGLLLTLPPRSALRFLDINDSGEVVYSARTGGPFGVFSTVRGAITASGFEGVRPAINNLGEVSYLGPNGIYSDIHGLVATVDNPAFYTDINDSGEIVYQDRDTSGFRQIFSTTRGQLTTSSGGNGGLAATINNDGDVVLTRNTSAGDVFLFALDGTQLTSFSIKNSVIDMNDFGDIVFDFGTGSELSVTETRVVLMTQRPEFFALFGFQSFTPPPPPPDSGGGTNPIPEPSSLALLITGAIGLIGYGWRRKRKQAA